MQQFLLASLQNNTVRLMAPLTSFLVSPSLLHQLSLSKVMGTILTSLREARAGRSKTDGDRGQGAFAGVRPCFRFSAEQTRANVHSIEPNVNRPRNNDDREKGSGAELAG